MTDPLLLGIDGGGTKTAARLAVLDAAGELEVLGEGFGGPSNVRAVGAVHATTNLGVAVDAALSAAAIDEPQIDRAILALAGSSLPDVQMSVQDWARRRSLAAQVDIVHDAEPVLAVGARDGRGIGLIVGTGSVAIGADGRGATSIVGGWGHWFGDRGSGFDIGRRGLQAVADALDGIGAATALSDRLPARLHVEHPREMTRQLAAAVDTRREIAALARVVLEVAEEQDSVAMQIIAEAVGAAAELVQATLAQTGLEGSQPLAVAGGIACSGDFYRDQLLAALARLGFEPQPLTVVSSPVQGSLLLARDRWLAKP